MHTEAYACAIFSELAPQFCVHASLVVFAASTIYSAAPMAIVSASFFTISSSAAKHARHPNASVRDTNFAKPASRPHPSISRIILPSKEDNHPAHGHFARPNLFNPTGYSISWAYGINFARLRD